MSQYTGNKCNERDDFTGHAAGNESPRCEAHPELGECLAAFRGDITRNGSYQSGWSGASLFQFLGGVPPATSSEP